MEEEERWIRMLRGLNVLPFFVCLCCIIIIVFIEIDTNTIMDLWMILLPFLSMITYLFVFNLEAQAEKKRTNLWMWIIGLIVSVLWVVIFSFISIFLFLECNVLAISVAIFIIGYPLIMLYYNFRLFMNEISKP